MSAWNDVPYYPEQEGFGTTYEDFHAKQILAKFIVDHHIRQVCEYPLCTWRIPGIVSAHLAVLGCEVTLASNDSTALSRAQKLFKQYGLMEQARFLRIGIDHVKSESFDLVFQFSLLSTMRRDLGIEPLSCVREMVRLSRNWILITNHNLNYSILFDYLLSRITGRIGEFGNLRLIGERPVKQILKSVGLKVDDVFLFDIPPWPAGNLPSTLVPALRRQATKGVARKSNRMIEETMKKYSFIENAAIPRFVKAIFAHHVGTVGVKWDPRVQSGKSQAVEQRSQ